MQMLRQIHIKKTINLCKSLKCKKKKEIQISNFGFSIHISSAKETIYIGS